MKSFQNIGTAIVVKIGKRIETIKYESILLIEGDDRYSNLIYLDSKNNILSVCVCKLLKKIEKDLPDYFYRSHKSNIVNLLHGHEIKKPAKTFLGFFVGLKCKDKALTFKIAAAKLLELLTRHSKYNPIS